MSERRIRRLVFAAFCLIAALFTVREASATDCFRQFGIGYGAGYNAPAAPCAQPSCAAKWGGYFNWKSACCQPGSAPSGCGCGPVAAPCCPSPCRGGCGPCTTCGPRHPAIY